MAVKEEIMYYLLIKHAENPNHTFNFSEVRKKIKASSTHTHNVIIALEETGYIEDVKSKKVGRQFKLSDKSLEYTDNLMLWLEGWKDFMRHERRV